MLQEPTDGLWKGWNLGYWSWKETFKIKCSEGVLLQLKSHNIFPRCLSISSKRRASRDMKTMRAYIKTTASGECKTTERTNLERTSTWTSTRLLCWQYACFWYTQVILLSFPIKEKWKQIHALNIICWFLSENIWCSTWIYQNWKLILNLWIKRS